jgi:hypothetical protein
MAEKACLVCLRAWPKPEFRQARQQREAQRRPAVAISGSMVWIVLSDELFLLVLFLLAAQKEKNIFEPTTVFLTSLPYFLYFFWSKVSLPQI